MKTITTVFISIILALALCAPARANQPASTQSRPNVSGGYDFYSQSGVKTGSSSKRPDGGYNYFDQHGNKTGSMTRDRDTGAYEYRDAEDINRGTITTDPYGGYRYRTIGEDTMTAEQTNIRRSHGYADPYGRGMETLAPDTLRGIDGAGQGLAGSSGLATSSPTAEGLSTPGSQTQPAPTSSNTSGLSIRSAD